jgi:hypothetical protein
MRTTPKTMLAWILPGRQWKMLPMEWMGRQKTNMMIPLRATM